MQNTMLDSTVSNSLQDNSSVEYVEPQKNPIATIPNVGKTDANSLFDFNAVHNGEHCIASLDPKDRGTERQFRFTRALLCTLLGVKSVNTIDSHVEALMKRGVVTDVRNLTSVMLPDSLGRECIKTTLYDLTVFNHLVMRLDTDQAWAMKAKFNDVLIKHETQAQPELTDAEIMSRALEIAHRTLALREERIKTLQAERDEAIRTKAQIGSSREATAMATASAKSRECKRLTAENAELKDAVGRGMNWHTVNMMTDEWIREFGHAPSWHKLKEFSADLPKDMQPIKDVEVKVVLRNGSEKIDKLFRYHREAWAKYREYEENSRVTDKNVPDTKILDLEATNTEIEVF